MNYGYAATPKSMDKRAVGSDNPEHLSLQLYWHVATSGNRRGELTGLNMLEIGSGRGGGAVFIAGNLKPKSMVALDFSSSATAYARNRYLTIDGLEFVQGDAESLTYTAASFDIVINIESAHCYGSLEQFLSEVHRVLRPQGELLFADFVSIRNGAFERMQQIFEKGPLQLISIEDITSNVV